MMFSKVVKADIKTQWLYKSKVDDHTEECIVLAVIADPQGRADEFLVLFDHGSRMRTVPVESLACWMSPQGTAHMLSDFPVTHRDSGVSSSDTLLSAARA